jgi:hypothetical protein
VSESRFSPAVEPWRSSCCTVAAGVDSRGVPEGSSLIEASLACDSGTSLDAEAGESGLRICEVVGSSRTKAGSRSWVVSRSASPSLERDETI